MNRRALLAAAVVMAAGVAVGGCQVEPDLKTRPVSVSFPTGMVPASLDGMQVKSEPSAATAFAAVGSRSAVARGEVWTLRRDGLVVGSVQVSQLKGGLTTKSDRIRRGIYGAVNNGSYRWFKVQHKQWVGLQEQPQLLIYLWLPPTRPDVFVVLQLKSDVPASEQVLTDLISYEEGAS